MLTYVCINMQNFSQGGWFFPPASLVEKLLTLILRLIIVTGCRFWVINGATEDKLETCKRYFNEECGKTKYLVYDKRTCVGGN